MGRFELQTIESAPEGSRETLEAIEEKYGFIPNLMREFANAPAALNGYTALSEAFGSSSLSAIEQEIVLLSAAVENECHYCVAVHTATALDAGAPQQAVQAIRGGEAVEDEKLSALREFTQSVVAARGWVDNAQIRPFLDAGFEEHQILEIITGIALKTLSNYTNHIGETPVDEVFEQFAWEGQRQTADV